SGSFGTLATALLRVGKRRPDTCAPRMQAAPRHGVQPAVLDLLEKPRALSVQQCARRRPQVRVYAVRPCEAENRMRALFGLRRGERQNTMEQFSVVANSHPA